MSRGGWTMFSRRKTASAQPTRLITIVWTGRMSATNFDQVPDAYNDNTRRISTIPHGPRRPNLPRNAYVLTAIT